MNAKKLKLLVRAGDIPFNEQIMKPNGCIIYTITKSIKIYDNSNNPPKEPQVIEADSNTRFLSGKGSSISAISADTELIWLTTLHKITFECEQEEHK